jgi:hypothetical protein
LSGRVSTSINAEALVKAIEPELVGLITQALKNMAKKTE